MMFGILKLKLVTAKLFLGEARVAGTQFAVNGKGYILSGDGDDHARLR